MRPPNEQDMSPVNEFSNIVDIGQRQDPRNERMGDLLTAVRGIGAKRLQQLAGSMFENVDDALFDLAEKAESNAVQTQYFDGMREVRRKRALVERLFHEQVARGISDFAGGRTPSGDGDVAPGPTPGSGEELSLIDDSDLEESLAIASLVSKTESRLARPLYAVNQRLSVICGGSKVYDSTNPIGPALLGQAFRIAMRSLEVDVRVKLIIYKLFDRYVMAGLDGFYDEINTELMQAGVLPQLRHESKERSNTTARAAAAATAVANTAAEATADFSPEETDEFRVEFLNTLNSLLVTRRNTLAGSDGRVSGGGSGPSLSPAELLGALSLLQGEVAHTTAQAMPMQPVGNATETVAELKAQLMQQIQRLRGDAKSRVSGADEDTIDLVGMLFEFILQDRNLPAEMQVLLVRLQIPYLKAAILDRRMFAHTSHPARRLLDALADAAKVWSSESDRDQRLYTKIRSIVETLLQEFDDDIHIFERLKDDLQNFLDGNRKRAELSEQRVAEATRGREKLQQARKRAAQEILSRIDKHPLPDLIRGILTRAWANYLVLTLLRQGEESPEFRSALRFVDEFVWSALPRQGDAERTRLRQLLPLLEKSLRHGLATVAFQDADVESLMGQLQSMYKVQLGEAPAQPEASVAMSDLPIPETVEIIAAPEIANEEPEEEVTLAEDDPNIARVRGLKVGNWVEFVDGESSERAKISWISPISGKYLFVNRRGLKVADKTVQKLAAELAAGTTVVLEELPLFDRALDAIVERLRKTEATTSASASNGAST